MWNERYAQDEYVYGKQTNDFFLKNNFCNFSPVKYYCRLKAKVEMKYLQH